MLSVVNDLYGKGHDLLPDWVKQSKNKINIFLYPLHLINNLPNI